jgi:group I intron endonuclease
MHGIAPGEATVPAVGIVYVAHNRATDKLYVGQTMDTLVRRKCNHHHDARRGLGGRIGRAIRDYGIASFDFFAVGSANTKEDLNKLEALWITILDTVRLGYNALPGTRDMRSVTQRSGWKQSEEAKRKISEALKGRPNPHVGPRLAALNKSRIGQKLSEEHKAKCSKALRGKKLPPRSAEYRLKMSLVKKGTIQSPEANLKRSLAQKGRPIGPQSESHRANNAAAQKAVWERKRACME